MNVDRIFTRDAIRVPRTATLVEAATLMRDRHVGALLVTEDAADNRRVIGIVTDRDLVIQAMADGVAPREYAVGEVMTRALSTVQRGASVGEALETMRKAGVRRLAVVEGIGEPIGILSLDDILAALGDDLGAAAAVAAAELEHEIARSANSAAISG